MSYFSGNPPLSHRLTDIQSYLAKFISASAFSPTLSCGNGVTLAHTRKLHQVKPSLEAVKQCGQSEFSVPCTKLRHLKKSPNQSKLSMEMPSPIFASCFFPMNFHQLDWVLKGDTVKMRLPLDSAWENTFHRQDPPTASPWNFTVLLKSRLLSTHPYGHPRPCVVQHHPDGDQALLLKGSEAEGKQNLCLQ